MIVIGTVNMKELAVFSSNTRKRRVLFRRDNDDEEDKNVVGQESKVKEFIRSSTNFLRTRTMSQV